MQPTISTLFPYTTLFRSPTISLMLTPRQELVLRKVVEEYLEAGAPVGSKALSIDVQWGPSTIRHELASLEELGLLAHPHTRSEEHTSELQSHSDLVCRLL